MNDFKEIQSLFPAMSEKEVKSIKGGGYEYWWDFGGTTGTDGFMSLSAVTIAPSGSGSNPYSDSGYSPNMGSGGGTGNSGDGGGDGNGGNGTAPPPGFVYGDHHLANTNNLPIADNEHYKQVGNLCVFQTMVNVSHYYNPAHETNIDAEIVTANKITGTGLTAINGFVGTEANLNTLLSTYFETSVLKANAWADNFSLIKSAISLDTPVMAYINGGAMGHEVMITGYNDDNTVTFFDPQTGEYNSTMKADQFDDLVAVRGVN